MHVIHKYINIYTYASNFSGWGSRAALWGLKKKAITDSSCKTWQTFNSSLHLRLAKWSRASMEDNRETVMGFSTGIFIYVISTLRMWKTNLYTDPGSLIAPTLINKNVPCKSDLLARKNVIIILREPTVGAGLPTWDFPVTGASLSILSQPFIPSLNSVTLCQFPSLILFSLVMTATPVPQLNLAAWDRGDKLTLTK